VDSYRQEMLNLKKHTKKIKIWPFVAKWKNESSQTKTGFIALRNVDTGIRNMKVSQRWSPHNNSYTRFVYEKKILTVNASGCVFI